MRTPPRRPHPTSIQAVSPRTFLPVFPLARHSPSRAVPRTPYLSGTASPHQPSERMKWENWQEWRAHAGRCQPTGFSRERRRPPERAQGHAKSTGVRACVDRLLTSSSTEHGSRRRRVQTSRTTPAPRLARALCRRDDSRKTLEAGKRLVAAEQFERLEERRRDAAARDRRAHGPKREARLEAKLVD